ncbi:MAG: hypothetical protein PPHEMADM_5744, partial [uncultured Paraburkholderia sp.]
MCAAGVAAREPHKTVSMMVRQHCGGTASEKVYGAFGATRSKVASFARSPTCPARRTSRARYKRSRCLCQLAAHLLHRNFRGGSLERFYELQICELRLLHGVELPLLELLLIIGLRMGELPYCWLWQRRRYLKLTVMPTFASELLIPKLKDSDDRTPDVHVRRGRSHRDAYIRHLEFRSGDPLAQANVDTTSSDCWLGMSCLSACQKLVGEAHEPLRNVCRSRFRSGNLPNSSRSERRRH